MIPGILQDILGMAHEYEDRHNRSVTQITFGKNVSKELVEADMQPLIDLGITLSTSLPPED